MLEDKPDFSAWCNSNNWARDEAGGTGFTGVNGQKGEESDKSLRDPGPLRRISGKALFGTLTTLTLPFNSLSYIPAST